MSSIKIEFEAVDGTVYSIEKDDADPNGKGKADEEDEESFDEEEEA